MELKGDRQGVVTTGCPLLLVDSLIKGRQGREGGQVDGRKAKKSSRKIKRTLFSLSLSLALSIVKIDV